MTKNIIHSQQSNNIDIWTFYGESTRQLTHCYHDYPARMIPQLAKALLERFGQTAQTLFDPYSGSGTSLVEASLKDIKATGTDLNKLARLIAKAKITTIDIQFVKTLINELKDVARNKPKFNLTELPTIEGITRLNFWFKEEVIQRLIEIKNFIEKIENNNIKLFFQVAFSETVRESSNTRNREFKLYRHNSEDLKEFNPDVYGLMISKLERNINGYEQYQAQIKSAPQVEIYDFNTVIEIPTHLITPESIDIVITSPPYGDSATTVAYGQYSHLSSAWLGLDEAPGKVDSKLMGGKGIKEIPNLPCKSLNEAIAQVELADTKRALEVAAFYQDLYSSIQNVAQVIRLGGYACYVVGNRKVKGVVLPTDLAVQNFFEQAGFTHQHTFKRFIPNKRMPLRNSPTNVTGALDQTMTEEYIVVMQRL